MLKQTESTRDPLGIKHRMLVFDDSGYSTHGRLVFRDKTACRFSDLPADQKSAIYYLIGPILIEGMSPEIFVDPRRTNRPNRALGVFRLRERLHFVQRD